MKFASAEEMPVLLRGDSGLLQQFIGERSVSRLGFYVAVIFLGAGVFGAAVGVWRDPLQAIYTAVKFPVILLLTATGNGLLNGMLAPVLGVRVSFRESLMAVFMSFAIASAILGAFAPLMGFLIWNTPALSANAQASAVAHSFVMVSAVVIIALAGTVSNVRLLTLLRQFGGPKAAGRTLFAWLVVNLLLGSQLSYILRPFIGNPAFPVQFLRPDALKSNFFEVLWASLQQLLSP